MGDPLLHVYKDLVDHPLWSRFLRWCTLRPKTLETPSNTKLAIEPRDQGQAASRVLEGLDDFQYQPLPDPQGYIRLATLLPGQFDDDVTIRIDQHILRPPSETGRRHRRLELVEVRKGLPKGWEAFQTIVENRYFFRHTATGRTQWEHPSHNVHTEQYEIPPRNDNDDDIAVPRYETLSYVWGDPEKSALLVVDNGPDAPRTKLRVTQSLATVLRYLRLVDTARTLWIDAVCLNQNDYAELSRQVPRMRDIYKLAYRGTAWLGKEDATSAHALAVLRHLGEQVVAEAETGLLFRSPDAGTEGKDEGRWYEPDFALPFSQASWDSILLLLHRPWFTRLWVVQEIQPAMVVQCGHDQVPVTTFTEAIYCLYAKGRLLPTGDNNSLRKQLEQATGTLARLPGLCLTRLLYRAATFKACGDPRDKIYGILGLAPRRFAASIPVRYETDVTAADVYARAFLAHARITQRLEHFHNCFGTRGANNRRLACMRDAPSWVPDWYSDVPGETYIPAQFAAAYSRAHFACADGDGLLRVQGVRCARVRAVSEALPPRLDRWEAIRRVRAWEPYGLDVDVDSDTPALYRPTGETLRRAYAVTLICGGLKEREPDWILSGIEEWTAQDWPEALFGERARVDDSAGTAINDGNDGIRTDVTDALQCCGGRLVAQTHEGYIGLAPADTQIGDIIVILLGCSTPIVLRPRADRGWTVVGECFVYGLHDAIALLGPLPAPWTCIAVWVEGDRRCPRFLNTETREVTREDPRLGALEGWERVEGVEVDGDEPILFDHFRDTRTGRVVNWDPRMEPEKLMQRGRAVEWLDLV